MMQMDMAFRIHMNRWLDRVEVESIYYTFLNSFNWNWKKSLRIYSIHRIAKEGFT